MKSILKVIIRILLSVLAALVFALVVTWLATVHNGPSMEHQYKYLADNTVWLRGFSDSQGSDTAISEPRRAEDSKFWYVKVKHINAGGSGGYVSALTEDGDLKPGDKLVLKELKTRSSNSEQMIIIAERAPTPRGH